MIPHLRDAAPPRKESEIQKAILDYLEHVPGVVAWRSNTGAVAAEHKGVRRFVRFGFPGLSDITGWVDYCRYPYPGAARCSPESSFHVPVWLAVEVKRPGGKTTPAQAAFLEMVRKAGGIAILAHSVEDVRKGLGLCSTG